MCLCLSSVLHPTSFHVLFRFSTHQRAASAPATIIHGAPIRRGHCTRDLHRRRVATDTRLICVPMRHRQCLRPLSSDSFLSSRSSPPTASSAVALGLFPAALQYASVPGFPSACRYCELFNAPDIPTQGQHGTPPFPHVRQPSMMTIPPSFSNGSPAKAQEALGPVGTGVGGGQQRAAAVEACGAHLPIATTRPGVGREHAAWDECGGRSMTTMSTTATRTALWTWARAGATSIGARHTPRGPQSSGAIGMHVKPPPEYQNDGEGQSPGQCEGWTRPLRASMLGAFYDVMGDGAKTTAPGFWEGDVDAYS
ncbi:hypothetical protein K438DRAFT_1975096 [Mycena galopus ATCC 62051]|nr:hypothetical protein K438DRAFT_1975096 [Mycena galopus ATCC 62051]